MTTLQQHPARGSVFLALASGSAAVAAVAQGPSQTGALGVGLLGAVVCWGGLRLRARSRPFLGVPVGLSGVALSVAGIGWGVSSIARPGAQFELLPGVVGLLLLGVGLGPLRRGWERRFVTLGASCVLVAVVASGLFRAAPAPWLLVGAAATVVAWDAGEQAVSLGEQVGGRATTWPVGLVHTGTSAVVGLVGVVLALSIRSVGVENLPVSALAILLGVALVLTLALNN